MDRSLFTLRVAGVPEPYNLPWHLAMERGAFTEAGIDLKWHTVPEGSGRMCQMLRDGQLDMAVLVTEAAVRDIMNGGPHRIVSTFVESPLPWGVHVPANSGLHVPQDLRGVPFAISRPGSGSHLMAMLHARKNAWTPTDDDFIIVNNMEGAAERMKDGRPLVFLWEKFVTSRYVEAGIMRRVDEIQGDWPGFVIVARTGLMPEPMKRIGTTLEILSRSVADLKLEAEPAERIMRSAGFSRPVAHDWLRQVTWHVAPPKSGPLTSLTRTLVESGLVGRIVEAPSLLG